MPPTRREGVSFSHVDPDDRSAIFGDNFISLDQLAGMERQQAEEIDPGLTRPPANRGSS